MLTPFSTSQDQIFIPTIQKQLPLSTMNSQRNDVTICPTPFPNGVLHIGTIGGPGGWPTGGGTNPGWSASAMSDVWYGYITWWDERLILQAINIHEVPWIRTYRTYTWGFYSACDSYRVLRYQDIQDSTPIVYLNFTDAGVQYFGQTIKHLIKVVAYGNAPLCVFTVDTEIERGTRTEIPEIVYGSCASTYLTFSFSGTIINEYGVPISGLETQPVLTTSGGGCDCEGPVSWPNLPPPPSPPFRTTGPHGEFSHSITIIRTVAEANCISSNLIQWQFYVHDNTYHNSLNTCITVGSLGCSQCNILFEQNQASWAMSQKVIHGNISPSSPDLLGKTVEARSYTNPTSTLTYTKLFATSTTKVNGVGDYPTTYSDNFVGSSLYNILTVEETETGSHPYPNRIARGAVLIITYNDLTQESKSLNPPTVTAGITTTSNNIRITWSISSDMSDNGSGLFVYKLSNVSFATVTDDFTVNTIVTKENSVITDYACINKNQDISFYVREKSKQNIWSSTSIATVRVTITSIVVGTVLVSGGSGYTSAPTVEITGGGGSGTTAIATIDSGIVTFVNITNPGSGYTSTPTINITGGGGSDAAATAILTVDTINAVQLNVFTTKQISVATLSSTSLIRSTAVVNDKDGHSYFRVQVDGAGWVCLSKDPIFQVSPVDVRSLPLGATDIGRTLYRSITYSGKITYDDGDKAMGIMVKLLLFGVGISSFPTTFTDENGEYKFEDQHNPTDENFIVVRPTEFFPDSYLTKKVDSNNTTADFVVKKPLSLMTTTNDQSIVFIPTSVVRDDDSSLTLGSSLSECFEKQNTPRTNISPVSAVTSYDVETWWDPFSYYSQHYPIWYDICLCPNGPSTAQNNISWDGLGQPPLARTYWISDLSFYDGIKHEKLENMRTKFGSGILYSYEYGSIYSNYYYDYYSYYYYYPNSESIVKTANRMYIASLTHGVSTFSLSPNSCYLENTYYDSNFDDKPVMKLCTLTETLLAVLVGNGKKIVLLDTSDPIKNKVYKIDGVDAIFKNTSLNMTDVASDDKFIYAANAQGGCNGNLIVVDRTTLKQKPVTRNVDTEHYTALDVKGNKLVTGTHSGKILFYSISGNRLDKDSHVVEPGSVPRMIKIINDSNAFVAGSNISVVDLTNYEIIAAMTGKTFCLNSDKCYTCTSNEVHEYNIQDPTKPQLTYTFTHPTTSVSFLTIAIKENYLVLPYVNNDKLGVSVVEVRNEGWQEKGNVSWDNERGFIDRCVIKLIGGQTVLLLFLNGDNKSDTIEQVSVSDPTNPQRLDPQSIIPYDSGLQSEYGSCHDFDVDGDQVYLPWSPINSSTSYYFAPELSIKTANWTPVRRCELPFLIEPTTILIRGERAYIGTSSNDGIWVIDANQEHKTIYGVYSTKNPPPWSYDIINNNNVMVSQNRIMVTHTGSLTSFVELYERNEDNNIVYKNGYHMLSSPYGSPVTMHTYARYINTAFLYTPQNIIHVLSNGSLFTITHYIHIIDTANITALDELKTVEIGTNTTSFSSVKTDENNAYLVFFNVSNSVNTTSNNIMYNISDKQNPVQTATFTGGVNYPAAVWTDGRLLYPNPDPYGQYPGLSLVDSSFNITRFEKRGPGNNDDYIMNPVVWGTVRGRFVSTYNYGIAGFTYDWNLHKLTGWYYTPNKTVQLYDIDAYTVAATTTAGSDGMFNLIISSDVAGRTSAIEPAVTYNQESFPTKIINFQPPDNSKIYCMFGTSYPLAWVCEGEGHPPHDPSVDYGYKTFKFPPGYKGNRAFIVDNYYLNSYFSPSLYYTMGLGVWVDETHLKI